MTELEAALNPDAPESPESREWDRLAERVHELVGAHPGWWLSELPALPGIEWGVGQFWGLTNGFVSSVVVRDGAAFVEQMAAVFAAAPVTDVKLNGPSDDTVRAIAGSPHLARLRGLRLSAGGCGDAGVAALAAPLHSAGLRRLALFMCRVGPAGAGALAHSLHFRPDLTLQLSGTPSAPAASPDSGSGTGRRNVI